MRERGDSRSSPRELSRTAVSRYRDLALDFATHETLEFSASTTLRPTTPTSLKFYRFTYGNLQLYDLMIL